MKNIADFMHNIRSRCVHRPTDEQALQSIANELRCLSVGLDTSAYRYAEQGEELMYPLCEDPDGGPSLYLVSDGEGVDTPPHDHQTWVVIVGLSGCEYHVFYEPEENSGKKVQRKREYPVGAGDVLILNAEDIHGINSVQGQHPTSHLHLYGRSQQVLPVFSSRCYRLLDEDNLSG